MNYQKVYDQLVEKCKPRGLDKTSVDFYTEIHHVIPRCLGGDDKQGNLIMLSGREHYIAHMLLWKLYPNNSKLMHAAWMMSHVRDGEYKVNSSTYEALKIDHAKWLSNRMAGKNSPNFKDLTGQRNGKLTVLCHEGWKELNNGFSTSTWLCKCDCGTYKVLLSKEVSQECKSAYKSCGCLTSEIASQNTGDKNPFFGRKHSEESKAKMAAKRLGKSPSNKGVLASQDRKDKIKLALSKIERFSWLHPMVVRDSIRTNMWKMADFYHELYLTNTGLTKAKFTTLYNKLYCDDLPPTAFYIMHDKFANGWTPSQDEDWVQFSEGG